jgi:hypothetical protein
MQRPDLTVMSKLTSQHHILVHFSVCFLPLGMKGQKSHRKKKINKIKFFV